MLGGKHIAKHDTRRHYAHSVLLHFPNGAAVSDPLKVVGVFSTAARTFRDYAHIIIAIKSAYSDRITLNNLKVL